MRIGEDASGALRGGLLHFDCTAGIAGDMAVGALVDLGVPEAVVRESLAALPALGYEVRFEKVRRGGIVGTKFRVLIEGDHEGHGSPHDEHATKQPAHAKQHRDPHHHHGDHADHGVHAEDHEAASKPQRDLPHAHDEHDHTGGHAHRHYGEIRAMLVTASLPPRVRDRALSIFDRIAAVESRLHGVPLEEVAFHEVGAVDSIVDIVGAAAALEWLAPARITSRVVALGHGSVRTAHGRLPVPAPATLALLAGAEVEDGGAPFELTTPTGAAILADCVTAFGPLPSMRVLADGYGAGDRELADRPNLLRVVVGRPREEDARAAEHGHVERCVVIEANVDDSTPELLGPLLAELLAAGARDAWFTPIVMKKGRPAWTVSALCDVRRRGEVIPALLRGSSTIGVRMHEVARTVLPRRMVEVDTPFGRVPVKVAGEGDRENVAPEMDACERLAREHGVARKRVYAEALAAYFRR